MKKGWLVLALIIALGLSGGTRFAQSTPPAQGEERPMDQERREELRKRVELIWMWKLTEELDLTEEEGAKVFPLLRQYEEQKRELRAENRRLIRELQRMIDAGASEGDLKQAIKALEENDQKRTKVQQEGFDALAKILPVEKQARYIVFQEHFRREIHGLIQKARHEEKGPGRP
jgi:Spy/CpxP family protein refolding chaperone